VGSEVRNDFQIGVDCLIDANKKYWGNRQETTSGKGWIYVLHTLHHDFATYVRENIVAKGVQERDRLPIVSVISGRADELMDLMDQVDESFGIEQRFHPSYYDYNNEKIEELARKLSSETYGNKDGLIGLTYRGIQFGDALYDDILRRGNSKKRGDIFDCFDVSQEKYSAFIRNALTIIDQAYAMFEDKKPCYLVTTEYFYTKSLYAHVACVLGAKILVTSIGCPDIVIQATPNSRQLSDVKLADLRRTEMEKCLREYRINEINATNLFLSESDNRATIKIPEQWRGKKNVVILPHAFSDAPREVSRQTIYHDYLEWFLDTIRIIREIPDVNWIIKDHPWAFYYKQEDYIKSIFEKNKSDNMYWIDRNYSGINLKDVADCVVTCVGTAGIEYWAYGIPTITTGDAFYCDWGISYQMRSLKEYENTLKNIRDIKKPSSESAELAGKYLFANKNWHKQCDPFSKLLYHFCVEDYAIWKSTGNHYGVEDSTDRRLGENVCAFCKSFALILQENGVKQSSIYRLENLVKVSGNQLGGNSSGNK